MGSGSGDEIDSPRRYRSNRDSGGGDYDRQLPRAMSNRTLIDIIRDEGGGSKESKRTWRHFKDKIRSKSGGRGSTWTSSVPVPTSDIPINNNNNKNRMMSRQQSNLINSGLESDSAIQPDISAVPDVRSSSLIRNPSRTMRRASGRFDHTGTFPRRLQREGEEEESEEDEHSEAEEKEKAAEGEEQRPVRMSLMSLLADEDEDGIAYGMDEDEEDEDEDEDDGGAVEYNNCCICMVRHKGTAFEPCGHSFCRLCSREMWVQGGNCPLCNNYILEILDIF